MPGYEKLIVVTRKTALEELVERFNTREQARFYLEHMGVSFAEYETTHQAYHQALATLKASLPAGLQAQFVDRSFLPTFTFGDSDLVVTLGPDGLVVNTAKYLATQPLLALNPDPSRIDGVLIPLRVEDAAAALRWAVRGDLPLRRISMARAELNDGQVIDALNDLFIGQQTHASARYRLEYQGQVEDQSSSGIIVSTGAGSTGWFRSILTGAAEVVEAFTSTPDTQEVRESYRFDWEADYLYFTVREPFISRVSSATLVVGQVPAREHLRLTSQMPQNGVIFSDGIEADYLQFNSGTVARVGLSPRKLNLFWPLRPARPRSHRSAQRHRSVSHGHRRG
jgi:NAD kinase